MEIKNNELLRQYETQFENGTLIVEYALQERKVFLTKLHVNEDTPEEVTNQFIEVILQDAQSKKFKVVPTHPRIALHFKKNPSFKELLPPGIKI